MRFNTEGTQWGNNFNLVNLCCSSVDKKKRTGLSFNTSKNGSTALEMLRQSHYESQRTETRSLNVATRSFKLILLNGKRRNTDLANVCIIYDAAPEKTFLQAEFFHHFFLKDVLRVRRPASRPYGNAAICSEATERTLNPPDWNMVLQGPPAYLHFYGIFWFFINNMKAYIKWLLPILLRRYYNDLKICVWVSCA